VRNARMKTNLVLALAVTACLAAPRGAAAEGSGPVLEAIQTDDGPRILFAGVGVGTKYQRAVERLGGDAVGGFFGRAGPITREVRLQGVPCDLMVEFAQDRVSAMSFWCRGTRGENEGLAMAIAAAFAGIPCEVDPDGASWGQGDDLVAFLSRKVEDGADVLALSIRG